MFSNTKIRNINSLSCALKLNSLSGKLAQSLYGPSHVCCKYRLPATRNSLFVYMCLTSTQKHFLFRPTCKGHPQPLPTRHATSCLQLSYSLVKRTDAFQQLVSLLLFCDKLSGYVCMFYVDVMCMFCIVFNLCEI